MCESCKNTELNYKKAYYYLFNMLTNITGAIKVSQQNAEHICTDDPPEALIEISAEAIIKNICDKLRDESDKEKDRLTLAE